MDMLTPSGTRMLQLAFGFAEAESPLTSVEKEFQAQARTILDQAIQDQYSIAMLWKQLLQMKEDGRIVSSAEDWWDQHLPGDLGSRQAEKLFRVADHFHKVLFLAYGVSKLDFLLRWGRLKRITIPRVADPGSVPIDFIENGQHITKAFKDCTVAELTVAVHPPVTHPQPQPPGSKIDPNLPVVTQRFLAVAFNRLSGYMDGASDALQLNATWDGNKDYPPQYAISNIYEDDFPNILAILNGVWSEIWDEMNKGKLPSPTYGPADARAER
jgi:hypothetical protein